MKSVGEIKEKLSEMKTTAQRLSEVFCRPTTEGECKLLGIEKVNIGYDICQSWRGGLARYIDKGRTQIPVSRFIDLIQDAICAWRLEADNYNPYSLCKDVDVQIDNGVVWLYHKEGSDIINTNVKTYTDLISLISLLK